MCLLPLYIEYKKGHDPALEIDGVVDFLSFLLCPFVSITERRLYLVKHLECFLSYRHTPEIWKSLHYI